MARKLCNVCNKRPVGTTGSDPMSAKLAGQCGLCMDEGGWENTHSDNDHDALQEALEDVEYGKTNHGTRAKYEAWLKTTKDEIDGCWMCFPELNLAQKEPKAKMTSVKKKQGFRRTQLNHKDMCTHAQTPKARKACKEAFWAGVKVMMTEGKLTEDQAWEHCIKALAKGLVKGADLNAQVKPGSWTVIPSGPKGGVINQLKASKPKAFGKSIVQGIKNAK